MLLYLLKVVGANIAVNVKSTAKLTTQCYHDNRRHAHPAKQHVNYWYLTNSEKDDWLERLHNLQRQIKHQLDHLSAKIAENIKHKGVIVDKGIHNDLTEIVNEHTSKMNALFPDNCFQKLFWMQQQKVSALKTARSMQWHPLMIKWCLYLSGRVYKMLQESGCITLLSQCREITPTMCIQPLDFLQK